MQNIKYICSRRIKHFITKFFKRMMIIRLRRWGWIAGSIIIFLAIIAEAMQSHALGDVSSDKVNNYLTATRFMFFNGLALIAIHLLIERYRSKMISYAGVLILTGTVLFSFTIIAKVFIDMKSWGWITPFGGTLLMVGWLLLIISAFRARY